VLIYGVHQNKMPQYNNCVGHFILTHPVHGDNHMTGGNITPVMLSQMKVIYGLDMFVKNIQIPDTVKI